MALKLTHNASETLNDVILHTLQEQGLEKAEALEQEIFNQFHQLPAIAGESDGSIRTVIAGSVYTIVYKQSGPNLILLAIIHSSRLVEVLNS